MKRMSKRLIPLLLLLLFSACSRLILKPDDIRQTPEWPQLGSNPYRMNSTPVNLLPPLELKWRHRASSAIGASLVTSDGTVLYGTLDGRIEGVHINSGKKAGRIKIRGNFTATCAVYRESIIVIRRISQPTLARYDPKTGKTLWKTNGSAVFTEPLIVGNTIYLSELKGALSSYNLEDGSKNWRVKLPAQSHASPALADSLIIVGDDKGIIHAFGKNGKQAWQFQTQAPVYASPSYVDGTVYVPSTDYKLYALNVQNGKKVWQFATEGKLYRSAAIADDRIVFGSTDHKVYCLDRKTGKMLWRFEANSVISTSPVIAAETVYIGSVDKNLYALNLNTGEKIWSYKAKGRIRTNPIIVKNHLLFASEDDRLYCFAKK